MNDHEILEGIRQRILELFGLYFHPNQSESLKRNLANVARALNRSQSLAEIGRWIAQPELSRFETDILALHLTVGETYFFRETIALNLLKEKIVPAVCDADIKALKRLKIWSAGCSSGEEPYSLAIVLKETLSNIAQWDIRLLATDVNQAALEKAKRGVFSPWSFRETPEVIKKKYFMPSGKNLVICPETQEMVEFSYLNLATDNYPSTSNDTDNVDVIFCRNVLMYLSPEMVDRIVSKFYNALNVNGWLITGQVELNLNNFDAFQRVVFGNGFFYRKIHREESNDQPSNHSRLFQTPAASKYRKSLTAKPVRTPRSSKAVNKASAALPQRPTSDLEKTRGKIDVLFTSSAFAECVKLCEDYLKKQVYDHHIAFTLAKSYANLGKLDKSEEIMEKLTRSDNNRADYFYFYAAILSEGNYLEKAEANLKKALYLDPGFLPARLSRSQVLKQLGKQKQANKEVLNLLSDIEGYPDQESLPGFDGITAGRIRQMAELLKGDEK
jgi:chemotaxis protein methyltransferase CheR